MFEPSTYMLFADITAAIHLTYVLFVVFGQFYILVGWLFYWPYTRAPWFRAIHLIMILIVSVQEILRLRCPLTVLESFLRRQAGETVNTETTFLMDLIHPIMFLTIPDWMFIFMYIGFGALVALTFFAMPPKRRTET